MKDELVSFETAMELNKKKECDIGCDYFYNTETKQLENSTCDNYIGYNETLYKGAPTQSLLQKWLRENHNISLIAYDCFKEEFRFQISKLHTNEITEGENSFDTYEEALEDGLQAALKLIK